MIAGEDFSVRVSRLRSGAPTACHRPQHKTKTAHLPPLTEREPGTLPPMNRREVQAKPHGFTPWVENVVGVLLLPMMLLVYLSPIIFVVGGIIWFGVVFGEDGTRV